MTMMMKVTELNWKLRVNEY